MAATGISSRSSLLPLRTLSPGGVAHRPTSLTQSSTAWSQQSTGNTDTGFPKSVQQSLDDLTAMISEQGLHTQANSASPNHKIPSRNPHWLLASWELHSQVISETDIDSTAPNRGCTRIFHAKHRLPPLQQTYTGLLQTGSYCSPQAIGSNGMRTPPTACCLCFICMHQG
jgi:hypothetical protein